MSAPEDNAVVPPSEPSPADATPPVDPSEQLELKLPDEAKSPKELGLWAGVLVLLALVVFWPAINGQFQWLDDRAVSPRMMNAPSALSDAWTGRWANPNVYAQYFPAYQPVAFSVNWLAYRLGGHDENGVPTPMAYHIVALASHALAAVLAWLVLRELRVPASWLVAAVFAMHPANAEAVSWINESGVPVSGLLAWGAAYCFIWYQAFRDRDAAAALVAPKQGDAESKEGETGGDPAQTWGMYGATVALFLLAALAWPAASAMPGVLMLALWWRNRLTPRDVALLAPVLAVTAILWLTNLALPRLTPFGGIPSVAGLGFERIVSLLGEGFGFAVMKVVVPYPLALLYRTSLVGGFVTLVVLLAAIAGAAYAAVVRNCRWPAVVVGALVLGTIPALNWFDGARHSEQVDPLAYQAVVPLAAAILAGVAVFFRKLRSGEAHTQLVVIASAVLLVALGGTAWARSRLFDNPVALWEDTSAKMPNSSFAVATLAEKLRLRAAEDASYLDVDASNRDLTAAITSATRAVEIGVAEHDPVVVAGGQRTWALALIAKGEFREALPHFAAATADFGARDADTLIQYGQALVKLGDTKQAIAELNRALIANPASAGAHRVLSKARHDLGDEKLALREAELAAQMDPRDLAAEEQLGEAYARNGKYKEALERYVLLFSVSPAMRNRGDLLQAVGRIKVKQGAYDDAVKYLTLAQQLDPKLKDIDADLTDANAKLKVAATTRPAMTRPSSQPALTSPLAPTTAR